MDFGIHFFPDVGPAEKTGKDYWQEALDLVATCDELGYTHVRTVEDYFNPYGGYSPNPIIFLTAAAMRSNKARLITGAVLPVFNHPLKLAGEIGMLDAISCGRLEVGFARAFLPHEFARFGVSVHETRELRGGEGMEQVRRLSQKIDLTQKDVIEPAGHPAVIEEAFSRTDVTRDLIRPLLQNARRLEKFGALIQRGTPGPGDNWGRFSVILADPPWSYDDEVHFHQGGDPLGIRRTCR